MSGVSETKDSTPGGITSTAPQIIINIPLTVVEDYINNINNELAELDSTSIEDVRKGIINQVGDVEEDIQHRAKEIKRGLAVNAKFVRAEIKTMEDMSTEKILDLNSKIRETMNDKDTATAAKTTKIDGYKKERETLTQEIIALEKQQEEINIFLNKIYNSLDAMEIEKSHESKTTKITHETKHSNIKAPESPNFTFPYSDKDGNITTDTSVINIPTNTVGWEKWSTNSGKQLFRYIDSVARHATTKELEAIKQKIYNLYMSAFEDEDKVEDCYTQLLAIRNSDPPKGIEKIEYDFFKSNLQKLDKYLDDKIALATRNTKKDKPHIVTDEILKRVDNIVNSKIQELTQKLRIGDEGILDANEQIIFECGLWRMHELRRALSAPATLERQRKSRALYGIHKFQNKHYTHGISLINEMTEIHNSLDSTYYEIHPLQKIEILENVFKILFDSVSFTTRAKNTIDKIETAKKEWNEKVDERSNRYKSNVDLYSSLKMDIMTHLSEEAQRDSDAIKTNPSKNVEYLSIIGGQVMNQPQLCPLCLKINNTWKNSHKVRECPHYPLGSNFDGKWSIIKETKWNFHVGKGKNKKTVEKQMIQSNFEKKDGKWVLKKPHNPTTNPSSAATPREASTSNGDG